jgi:hypothetical protein
VQTDAQGFEQPVPPLGTMRLVISPNGSWIGVCTVCHKLLKQSLFPEKAVMSCPQCRCCVSVKMDLILDQILSAKRKKERVVLFFSSIG